MRDEGSLLQNIGFQLPACTRARAEQSEEALEAIELAREDQAAEPSGFDEAEKPSGEDDESLAKGGDQGAHFSQTADPRCQEAKSHSSRIGRQRSSISLISDLVVPLDLDGLDSLTRIYLLVVSIIRLASASISVASWKSASVSFSYSSEATIRRTAKASIPGPDWPQPRT